jgi:hypothetical protein
VKNPDFTPKNHIFSNFRGSARRMRPPPPWIRLCLYLLNNDIAKFIEYVTMVTDLSLSQFFFIRRVLIYGFDVMLNLEMPYEATNMYQVENEAI